MPTDEELVAAVARGDRRSLNLLYRRHAPWLAGRLAAATSSQDLAEEALQDTFVAAWRGASAFRGEGDVGAWLWGIARRRLVSLVRRTKTPPPPPDVVSAPGPDEAVLASDDVAEIRGAVARLAPQFREAIEVVVFGATPLDEAAARLGVPIGTLKSRLHRARSQLRIELTRP